MAKALIKAFPAIPDMNFSTSQKEMEDRRDLALHSLEASEELRTRQSELRVETGRRQLHSLPAEPHGLRPVCAAHSVSCLGVMAEPEPEPERDTEETDITTVDPDDPPSCSSLTTKELQQNWRAVKQRERPVRLLFEIPSTRIIEHTLSKHVVYEVVVMRSGSFDSCRVSVERRYSDFSRFHHRLLEEFDEELEEVLLPRKLLTGNFSPEIISERRLSLQDYLAKLYSVRCVRRSPLFPKFFTEQEQKRAHGLLRAGQFRPAVEQLQTVLDMEEKLLPWQQPTLIVPTLSALAVCYRDLEEPEQAFAAAHRALPAVRRYRLKHYRAALLELLVDVGYQLGRPVAQLQEELTVLRDAERGEVSSRSLKELVVQEFT